MGRLSPQQNTGLILIFLLFVSGGGEARAQASADSLPTGVTPETIRAGYALFQGASCRSCHGDMGRGGLQGGPNLRDNEWLHSEGDFEGIFQTIRWGVRSNEMKAQTRPWEMRPGGGMQFSTEELRSITAFLWAQNNGDYTETAADAFVEFVFVRNADEVREEYARVTSERGEPAISAMRVSQVIRDVFNSGNRPAALALGEIALDTYPERAQVSLIMGQIYVALGRRDEGLALVERAIELDPDDQSAQNYLRAQRGG